MESRRTSPLLLVADDDARMRSLVAACVRDVIDGLEVLEAEDGADAVRLGLQRRPDLALLDVGMPRLDGIDAAVTLLGLQPYLRVALHSADPSPHRARAREHRLPLFDKLELDRAVRWLELHAQPQPRLLLECAACGYGVARTAPPERCPMCCRRGTWRRRRRMDAAATAACP
jgi:CheY-like chemotaxis protein